jgi:hypothetical protein
VPKPAAVIIEASVTRGCDPGRAPPRAELPGALREHRHRVRHGNAYVVAVRARFARGGAGPPCANAG